MNQTRNPTKDDILRRLYLIKGALDTLCFPMVKVYDGCEQGYYDCLVGLSDDIDSIIDEVTNLLDN